MCKYRAISEIEQTVKNEAAKCNPQTLIFFHATIRFVPTVFPDVDDDGFTLDSLPPPKTFCNLSFNPQRTNYNKIK
jgi:hypothetical protein